MSEERDTWESIEADAMKTYFEYWGCNRSPNPKCPDECPAMTDMGVPLIRYNTFSCSKAQMLDIVRRCKALAGEGE